MTWYNIIWYDLIYIIIYTYTFIKESNPIACPPCSSTNTRLADSRKKRNCYDNNKDKDKDKDEDKDEDKDKDKDKNDSNSDRIRITKKI